MKTILYNLIGISAFLLTSCGGGGDDTSGETPTPTPVTSPKATTLVFPNNNSECTEGTVISTSESTVEFRWNTSENTDTYEVNLKNLATGGVQRKTVTTTNESFTIERGTPFEWFVISKGNGTSETASSSIWKFYNQGSGVTNYAPFPADVLSPLRGSTIANATTVSLRWTGSDVDNDITEYEVFFGTSKTTLTSIGQTTETSIEATISSGVIYYWKVITIDSKNNTSSSETFEFKVG
ncbi:hypothetical protein MWU65_12060 [Cellulophaga sp. F20128]|uniref:hypothetical protein n=1 Tax=Cellulophaga sp. F20128 TaxID=2926413 RepID=UPI001FF3B600|nr:hypothetical protein [Cellulophaga sp. F20128]MCK0157921.1 hypothetical protein [Cellulophaga sp. F20128]